MDGRTLLEMKVEHLTKWGDWFLQRIGELDSRVKKLESSALPDIAVAKNVADHTPESPSAAENDEPPAAIDLNLTEAMRYESVRLDPNSDLAQKSKSRILEKLWCRIEEAQSAGISWTCFLDQIDKLISERKNGA